MLTAGFPCQPFSVAGEKKGFSDPRGELFFEITRLLREFGSTRPRIVLLENVPHLINHDRGRTSRGLRDELQRSGYWFFPDSYSVLNTRDHSDIPQNRSGSLWPQFATKDADWNDFRFPEPVPETRPLQSSWIRDEKQGDWFYFQRDSQYLPMFEEEMKKGDPGAVYVLRRNYVRQNKSNEVFTLMANMGEGGHNIPVIRDDWGIRKLTLRECVRLQGFDDSFMFPGETPLYNKYRQVGNSVTVALVRRLAASAALTRRNGSSTYGGRAMIGWAFPPNNEGQERGPNHSGIETFLDSPLSSLARETCQNTCDAALSDAGGPVEIHYQLDRIDPRDLPGLDKLGQAIDACAQYWATNRKGNCFLREPGS